MHPKPTDISKVLDGAIAILGVKAKENNIGIVVELAEEARYVKTDPVWLKQVILNLLSNSLKFTDHGGRVDVRVSLDGDLLLQVQDTGIGMSKDEQAKLFGLFSQANEMISAKFGGSGLGLHIIKQVL